MSREAGLRLGPETEAGGANMRTPGGCQATNEPLAMIRQFPSKLFPRIYLSLKEKNNVFCIQVEILKRSPKTLYIVVNICLEFTQLAKVVVNVSVMISSLLFEMKGA